MPRDDGGLAQLTGSANHAPTWDLPERRGPDFPLSTTPAGAGLLLFLLKERCVKRPACKEQEGRRGLKRGVNQPGTSDPLFSQRGHDAEEPLQETTRTATNCSEGIAHETSASQGKSLIRFFCL